MNYKLVLILIAVLGFVLRAADINNNPPSLYGDELTMVYDSFSLLKTGRDQLGNPFPLTFQMGAGRPAGYVYGSIPFVAIFGPSALGVRSLSILSGIGIIILLYYIGKKLFSQKVGLATAFIAATSPWDIALSRGGFEAHFALFLALVGTYLFLLGKNKPILYIFSAIFFGLTLHTYPTYKLVLPLFLIALIWYQGGLKGFFSDKLRIHFVIAAVILILFASFSASQSFFGGSEGRFANINVFSNQQIKSQIEQKINLERNISNLPPSFLRYFHNKPVEYAKILVENYLQNFSLDFLVIHGDRNPRHNMATMGQVYLAMLVLFMAGLLALWQQEKKILIFLLLWILLSPLASAMIDTPHSLRSSFMLPPIIIISSLGLASLVARKNKVYLIVVSVLFLVQFTFFVQKLFFLAPNEYSRFWSYPAKLVSEMAMENKDKFKLVVISDRIDNVEFAYPVYARIDPSLTIVQNRQRTAVQDLKFKKLDNIYIGFVPPQNVEKFLENLGGSILYIGSAEEIKSLSSFETIAGLDGLPALAIKRIAKE